MGLESVRERELLDQIEGIILAEGFQHLRVGGLASRLHCSRTTLYLLAPSKDELVLRVISRWADAGVADAEAKSVAGESAAEKVLVYIDTVRVWLDQASPEFWRDLDAREPARRMWDDICARAADSVRGYLDAGIEDGSIRPLNSVYVATVIWLAARATRDTDLLDRAGLTSSGVLGELGRFLRSGLSEPTQSSG